MIADNDEYNRHLFKKHNLMNVSNKDVEFPWEIEYEGSPKFLCLFCAKSQMVADFFRHYMCYHRFTLKCFTAILSGQEIPFTIDGAQISSEFLATHLQDQIKFGYVDALKRPLNLDHKALYTEDTSNNLLEALIPEIKQEIVSDSEENFNPGEKNEETVKENPKEEQDEDMSTSRDENVSNSKDEVMSYKGVENFDITLTEVIILQDVFYKYIDSVLERDEFSKHSKIDYTLINYNVKINMDCPVCDDKDIHITDFTMHLLKMHLVRSVPPFCCRVCTATFDTESEFKGHEFEEFGDFEHLWICQFCDSEFDNREDTRAHLATHKEDMMLDNCFSPHLGFKCRYCPTLFWTERERETHHTELHFTKHKEEFYKCFLCDEVYSDKVRFFLIYYFFALTIFNDTIIDYN